jgi:hypothetical protein
VRLLRTPVGLRLFFCDRTLVRNGVVMVNDDGKALRKRQTSIPRKRDWENFSRAVVADIERIYGPIDAGDFVVPPNPLDRSPATSAAAMSRTIFGTG